MLSSTPGSGPPQEGWRLGRRAGLDGLRGIAVLMVVVGHVAGAPYLNGGGVGVTLFFVLSGFLITALLLEERDRSGRISFGAFYARRARRLAPALAVMLFFVTGFEVLVGMHPWGGLLAACFYVANWAEIAGVQLGYFDHTWSLAVEEQFYLAWPLLLVLLRRRAPMGIARWCLAGAAVSVALRWTLWYAGASTQRIYDGTDTRCDALLIGCALAAALRSGWRPRPRPVLAGCALTGLAVLGLWRGDFAHAVAGPTLAVLLAVPVLLAALEPGRLARASVLRWFGARSYGLYLWHVPLVYLTPVMFPFASLTLGRACGAVAAVGVAAISWRYLERPILQHAARPRGVGEVEPGSLVLQHP